MPSGLGRRGWRLVVLALALMLAGCAAQDKSARVPAPSASFAQQERQTQRLQLLATRQQQRADDVRALTREKRRAVRELTELAGLTFESSGSTDSADARYGSSQDGDPRPWVQRGPDATKAPNSDRETIGRFMAASAAGRITLVGAANRQEVVGGLIDDRLLRLLLVLSQRHRLTVNSLRITHPENVQDRLGSAVPSNHPYGRAADISAVDDVSCGKETRRARYRTVLDNPPPRRPGPCLSLAYEAAAVPGGFAPQEVIYYWRVPGPVGVSLENHNDHVHVGFRSYPSVGIASALTG